MENIVEDKKKETISINNFCVIDDSSVTQLDDKIPSIVATNTDKLIVRKIMRRRFGIVSCGIILYENGYKIGEIDEIVSSFCNSVVDIFRSSIGRFAVLINTDIYDENIVSYVEMSSCDFAIISVADDMRVDAEAISFAFPILCITSNDYNLR